MASRPSSKKRNSKAGPHRVRAWFDTVINPLLNMLKVEAEYLERKNWTWQFKPERLESIVPIRDMVGYEFADNLEQFLEFYPQLKELLDDYEDKRNKLLLTCKELHQAVKKSPELEERYNEATTEASVAELNMGRVNDIFDSYPPKHHLDVLAQYIVNNTDELPFYSTTWRLWEKYRDGFLAILDTPTIRPHYRKTSKVGEALLMTIKQLIRELREIRKDLASEHDLPYVSPQQYSLSEGS